MNTIDTHESTGKQASDDRGIDELERDASRQRERVGRTLGELEQRLSPDRMVDNAMGLFKEHGGDIADGLQRSVKSNPLPVILTGIGIAWMMLGQREERYSTRRSSLRGYNEFSQPDYDLRHLPSDGGLDGHRSSDHGDDAGGSAIDRIRDSVTEKTEAARRSAEQLGRSASERMSSLQEDTTHASRNVQSRLSGYRRDADDRMGDWGDDAQRFLQEQPLVAGGLGIAIGALIGALLPVTKGEERVARQAARSDTGQRAIEGARETARSLQGKADEKIDEVAALASKKIDESKREVATES